MGDGEAQAARPEACARRMVIFASESGGRAARGHLSERLALPFKLIFDKGCLGLGLGLRFKV